MTGYVPVQLAFLYLAGGLSVLATSAVAFIVSRRWNLALTQARMRYMLAVTLGCSLYIPISQYLKYQSPHFYVDFSHWMQLLFSVVQTGRPESLNSELIMPGSLNYLSAHFVPLIYVLAVPFAVFPYAETVICLNFVLLLSSVVPCTD